MAEIFAEYMDLISGRPWSDIRRIPTALVSLSVALFILYSETKKRLTVEVIFPDKARCLQFFSYSCLVFGAIKIVFDILQPIDCICVISHIFTTVACILQFSSMEYFQLSRLHYCFSRERVHSKNGYPKWLFIVMYIAPSVCGVLVIASWTSMMTRSECDFEVISLSDLDVMTWSVSYGSFFSLDVFTAFLCWFKVRRIQHQQKSKESNVMTNIQTILHRMLLLTIFYLFVAVITQMTGFLFPGINTVACSVSMYLMQDHNTKEYVHFLYVLKRFKLYLCCCCRGGRMVKDQYQAMVHMLETDSTGTVKKQKSIESTMFETIGDAQPGINKTGMELSLQTQTLANLDEGVATVVVLSSEK